MLRILIGSVETIEIRHPGGDQQLPRATTCCVCHKPIRPSRSYRVRTVRTPTLPAPEFYYSHIRCKEYP